MNRGVFTGKFGLRSPVTLWSIFVTCLTFSLSACGKKDGTPDWDTPGAETGADVTSDAEIVPEEVLVPESVPDPTAPATPAGEGLRFIAYNVENWLTMDRFVDDKPVKDKPKPDSEKAAVIRILVSHRPDILGLCEIGTADDLAEIQESLKSAGVDLPHLHYSGGSDPVRHLGLLSRHPISSTSKSAKTEYSLLGKSHGFGRAVLDATISARGKSYRFLGVHLKSKRQTEEGDEEEMRLSEARLLRDHVDSILKSNPNARLVVYGDFNDTRPSRPFKVVTGSYNSPGYLTAIPFKDSRGHAWTHHWAPHDIYSRIDFVTVTRTLRQEVDFRASYIADDPFWDQASDHRPLVAIFR
jgi:endonuclease/exonuclease/phosphatase family metal-dependent hydrolase